MSYYESDEIEDMVRKDVEDAWDRVSTSSRTPTADRPTSLAGTGRVTS